MTEPFIGSLQSDGLSLSTLCFFHIISALLGLFFCIHFRMSLSVSTRKLAGLLTDIALNLYTDWGRMGILILSAPVREHRVSLPIFRYNLIPCIGRFNTCMSHGCTVHPSVVVSSSVRCLLLFAQITSSSPHYTRRVSLSFCLCTYPDYLLRKNREPC